jgi:hypothetical protein
MKCSLLAIGSVLLVATSVVAQEEGAEKVNADDRGPVVEAGIDELDVELVEVVEAEAVAIPALMMQPAQDDEAIAKAFLVRKRDYYLAFVDRCCELSDDQIVILKAIDDAALDLIITPTDKPSQKKNKAITADFFKNAQNQPSSVNTSLLESKLIDQINTVLTEEQAHAFNSERNALHEFQRQVAADSLTELVSSRVSLRPDQLKPVAEEFEKLLQNKSLLQNTNAYVMNGFLPEVSTSKIESLLDKEQRLAFLQIQKVTWGNVDVFNRQGAETAIPLGEK